MALNIKDLKPNTSFKIYYGKNNINNKIIHIRSIVDKNHIVFRTYSKRKGWQYTIRWYHYFELLIENNNIFKRDKLWLEKYWGVSKNRIEKF